MNLFKSILDAIKNQLFFLTHRVHSITVYSPFKYGGEKGQVFYKSLGLMTKHHPEIDRVDSCKLLYRDEREIIQSYQQCFSSVYAAVVQGEIKALFIHPEDCDWALGCYGDRPKERKIIHFNAASTESPID